MTLLDFLILLLVFVIGWRIGQVHQYIKMQIEVLSALSELTGDKDTDELAERIDILYLEIEEINGIKLLYEIEGNFICQGHTIDELASLFYERTNKKAGVLLYNDSKLFFVNGKALDKIT
jgi:hypothetical protein